MQYSLSNKDISTVLVGMNSVKQVPVHYLPLIVSFSNIEVFFPLISKYLAFSLFTMINDSENITPCIQGFSRNMRKLPPLSIHEPINTINFLSGKTHLFLLECSVSNI